MLSHHDTIDFVLKSLQSNPTTGLSNKEAQKRLQENGPNKLQEEEKKTILQRFAAQFKDAMILILIAAACISFVVAFFEGHGFFEPLLILLIVVANAVLGVVQENKAEKALEALKTLSSPHCRVLREGRELKIDAQNLVLGDIMILEAGDIPASDARILEASNLKCDESALTGESVAVEKNQDAQVASDAPLGDRFNMIFTGCPITYGNAKAVVTATSMNTELGKIANLLAGEETQQTPLQIKLSSLGKTLGYAALVACVIIFGIGIVDKMKIMEIFMISVSLAVSAIPEGLPAIVTVILAISVQRMVKRNAIIRRLPAVETLGSASVICSDKTGTLTQNKMTLTKVYADSISELEDITDHNSEESKKVLLYATLCSDGSLFYENGKEMLLGDPTETSIIVAAYKNGMRQSELQKTYPRLAGLPFDSDRKLMTSINQMGGKKIVIVKGAFDSLEQRCSSKNLKQARDILEKLSADALRILGVAYKEIEEIPEIITSESVEKDLTFLGLVGMIDPPREEAAQAVKLCKKAGIKVVMITGDHVTTAKAIALQLGILTSGDNAVTGSELQHMSDQELQQQVRSISVYARVSPSDKIRIVKAWQTEHEVVAMTGDGVNDAPALKAADIGCAMGITGTEVAKSAADMTLADDNFATIVEAVKEGRGIYDNIKKVVGYLLSTNVAEIFTVFLAMLFWRKTPLLSMQLLWINLITDSLPAIALGMEPLAKDIMDKKPKKKSEGLFANGMAVQIILQGVLFATLTLLSFHLGWKQTGDLVSSRTMAFFTLATLQLVQSFNMRSQHSLFATGFFTNATLNKALMVSLVLLSMVLFIPVIASAFALTVLPVKLYGIALLLSLVPLPVLELAKKLGLIRYLD